MESVGDCSTGVDEPFDLYYLLAYFSGNNHVSAEIISSFEKRFIGQKEENAINDHEKLQVNS